MQNCPSLGQALPRLHRPSRTSVTKTEWPQRPLSDHRAPAQTAISPGNSQRQLVQDWVTEGTVTPVEPSLMVGLEGRGLSHLRSQADAVSQ